MLVRKVQGDDLRRIADSLEPELRDGFLTAAKQLKDDLPLNEMTDLIEAEDFDGLNRLVSKMSADTALFTEPMTSGIIEGGTLGATEIGMSFNIQNPAVARWAEANSGALIVDITTQTQQTVASMVADSVRQGVPPRTLARNLRSVVGLTDKDARSVARYHQGLIDAGSSRSFADKARDKMAARRLKNRATVIARTESIKAANQGQLQAWVDARDEGLIPATAQRVWIASPDDRTCVICNTLDDTVVGLVGDFSTGDQLPKVTTAQLPPAHPQCRCTTGLLFEGDEGFVGQGSSTPQQRIFNDAPTPERPFTIDDWLDDDSSTEKPWEMTRHDLDVEGRFKTGIQTVNRRGTATASNLEDRIVVTDKWFEMSKEGRKQALLHEYGHDVDRFLTGPANFDDTLNAWDRGVFQNADGVTLESHQKIGEAISDSYAAIVGDPKAVEFYIERGWGEALEYTYDAADAAGLLPSTPTEGMKLVQASRVS